jgi:hypothetical protein
MRSTAGGARVFQEGRPVVPEFSRKVVRAWPLPLGWRVFAATRSQVGCLIPAPTPRLISQLPLPGCSSNDPVPRLSVRGAIGAGTCGPSVSAADCYTTKSRIARSSAPSLVVTVSQTTLWSKLKYPWVQFLSATA